MNTLLIRLFDVCFSFLGILLTSPIFVIVYILCLCDTGSPIFKQVRLGRYLKPFTLVKFRTMGVNTHSVASHLVNPSAVTPLGHILRKTKLDELPQLWNVLKGEMSLVGPRPCLPTQSQLIEERSARSVFDIPPGITGLAQVNCIDMSTPRLLAETDEMMMHNKTVKTYFLYILMTLLGKGSGDRVKGEK